MDKEMLLNSFKNSGATVAEIYKGGGGEQRILPKSFVINMVEKLDEPEITEAQAWETLAPRFSMTAIELERQVLDGFLAMTAEEIEMESDKIKRLAKGIKKLHAENEELKAKLDNPEKVVIPQFVADAFDYNKKPYWEVDESKDVSHVLKCVFGNEARPSEFLDWVRENPEDYVMAVRNGYEIKKEPLYIISMPKTDDVLACWENEVDFEFTSEASIIGNSDWKYTFTESEIKSIDERFWPFAELVEETP